MTHEPHSTALQDLPEPGAFMRVSFTTEPADLLDSHDALACPSGVMHRLGRFLLAGLGLLLLLGAGIGLALGHGEERWRAIFPLAIGFLLLWRHGLQPIMTRLELARTGPSEGLTEVLFSDGGVTVRMQDEDAGHLGWAAWSGVSLHPKGLLLRRRDTVGQWVPLRAFVPRTQMEALAAFIASRLDADPDPLIMSVRGPQP